MNTPRTPIPPEPPLMAWPLRPATRRHLTTLADCAAFLDRAAHAPADGSDDPLAAIDRFECDLQALYRGARFSHPMVHALAPVILGHGLPAEPLHRMVHGARAERLIYRYGTSGQVVEHCHRVADPLGELALHLLGGKDPAQIALSDFVCTGTWLANYLINAGEYWRAGRCYLAKEDLDRCEVVPSDLSRDRATTQLCVLVATQAQRARALLDAGAPLVSTLHGRARLAVSGHLARMRALLAQLERNGHDPLSQPVRVAGRGTLAEWTRSVLRTPG